MQLYIIRHLNVVQIEFLELKIIIFLLHHLLFAKDSV